MTDEKPRSGYFTLVLLGTKGAGKSSTGNTILGREAFKTERCSTSATQDIAVQSGTVDELSVIVYDTPGFCDTNMSEEEMKQLMKKKECDLGPCAFILVLRADRFTEEDRETVEKVEKILEEECLKKTWIIFTRGDELENRNMTIQEFINENEPLNKLMQKYDQRYQVFNNKRRPTKMQVKMLLTKMIQNSLGLKGES
ncbi:hypothetical protein QQF64_025742 [Cirrhinus molitorella]|uniref:AIG1-type G domain-containing protein n=1 Tax=Cirrhinus molitorella TaxID=172907 RepID=A0ABR3NQ76_9TELE